MAQVTIRDNWTVEDIDLIISRHRALYEEEYGFDKRFGDYVADSLSGKIERIWIAEQDGHFKGCIGLVESDHETGQLRWLLIEPSSRGIGLGKKMMQALIDYCNKKRYTSIFLWTVNKLPTARALYERFGFQLTERKSEQTIWGQKLSEERWDLSLWLNR